MPLIAKKQEGKIETGAVMNSELGAVTATTAVKLKESRLRVLENDESFDDTDNVFSRFQSEYEASMKHQTKADERKYYYGVLGLPTTASIQQAKQAFRKMTLLHHPDRKGGNVTRFMEIREALMYVELERVGERGKDLPNEQAGKDDAGGPRSWWKSTWSCQLSKLKSRRPSVLKKGESHTRHFDRDENRKPCDERKGERGAEPFDHHTRRSNEKEKEGELEIEIRELQRNKWRAKLEGLKLKHIRNLERRHKVKKITDGMKHDDA
eukprot:CAMPEP_0185259326 /NCGR_PEP_ID=MMETSP1359-20130426/8122_1 /TAXON_ID=552665 /ORGANISM="Bigelowiella longifila, Strain CCMP242" /LENGTH=265 /DNA_ID=CAMNT_0027845191 /DNA_START=33 /DNA_END=830 /DNA_ORIENTATION=+